ncbi:MAG: AAA family ATPase [Armatimonadia bacterium]|nr:AAA family ATPase [Armatimonadia bacterium]
MRLLGCPGRCNVRALALVCRKGGVGKSAIATNLAAALSSRDHRVMLCDLDPQAASTVGLGVDYTAASPTLDEVFQGEASLADALVVTRHGVDVAPACPGMARTENALLQEPGRERILLKALVPLVDQYDWVIIDTPPSLATFTLNALVAADFLAIPAIPEFPSVEAVAHTLETIQLVVERELNPELRTLGVIANKHDTRTKTTAEVLRRIEALGVAVFETTIRKAVAVTNAYAFGEPVLSFDPKHPVADEFRSLTEEVLSHA